MSKYHKLNDLNARPALMNDENFSLLFTDNNEEQQQEQEQQPHHRHHTNNSQHHYHLNSHHNVVEDLNTINDMQQEQIQQPHQHQQQYNNNNNNNNSNNTNNSHNNNHNIISRTILDTDDNNIMEIPLLHNNTKDYEHIAQQPHTHDTICHCEQPGFSTNLTNKSTQEAKYKILLAISLCCIFMFIEFLGGYMAGSLAIMTDAAHLASDCIAFIIGLVAIWLGSRPPDKKMSFGYKRMEVLGAIASILGIWILTATLVMMAIERICLNDFDLDANTMMLISGVGILINIIMVFILHGSSLSSGGCNAHGHSHSHHAHTHAYSDAFTHDDHSQHEHSHSHLQCGSHTKLLVEDDGDVNASAIIGNGLKNTQNGVLQQHQIKLHNERHNEKNLNLRAAMIHVIGDLVQSIGVFLASVLIKFCPNAKIADPLCTLLFSIIVILTTVKLFKESVGILMDAVPRNINLNELEMDLSHIEGVKSVHHLNVWSHTSNYSVLMAHLVIDLLADSNTVLEKATQLATSPKYKIKHCTIQIERLTS